MRGVLTRSLGVWRYLGLHAAVGFVLAFVGMVAFVGIAADVRVGDDLAYFDDAVIAELQREVSQGTLQTFAIITRLGDPEVLSVIVVAGCLVFALRRKWFTLYMWLLATAGGGALVLLLKATFARARPFHEHGFAVATGWSFPSGHTSGATLVYGMLGYLLVGSTPRAWHIPIAIVGSAVVVFVGFSRLILQVHYLTDVLAGYLIGATWLMLCVSGFAVLRRGLGPGPQHRSVSPRSPSSR